MAQKKVTPLIFVYAIVGLLAAVWLLLLSLLLGWPGFVGMLLLIVGIGITVVHMTGAIARRSLSTRTGWPMAGVALLFVGAAGLVWGAIARIF